MGFKPRLDVATKRQLLKKKRPPDHPPQNTKIASDMSGEGSAVDSTQTYSITVTQDWLVDAPKPPPHNPENEEKYSMAHDHPLSSGANENTTKALKNLLRFGLVVEPSGGNSLAHYIADAVLNYALHKNSLKEDTSSPFKFSLQLDSGQELWIPARNALLSKDPPDFTSNTDAAIFRKGKRPRQTRTLEDVSKVDNETCRKIFKRACIDSMEDLVRCGVAPILKKKQFTTERPKEQLLEDKKTELVNTFNRKERIPAGTMTKAVDAVRSEYKLNSDFSSMDLQKIIGDPKDNVLLWKEVVNSDFSQVWKFTVPKSEEDGPNKTDEVEIPIEGPEDESDNEDSEDETEDEEESDSRVVIKTCSTTLRNILRPVLQGQPESKDQSNGMVLEDHHDRIVSILTERQTELTDVISELSALTHKTTLLIASGELYDESLGPPSTGGFDVRNLLPPEFKLRCDSDPIINVAPIPMHLQDHLETSIEKHRKDDLTQILSQYHLQHLHKHFLSSNKVKADKGKHPLWSKVAKIIKEKASYSMNVSPKGLSHTITEQTKQYSTAVNNLWEGSIFDKSMDYLLWILLRLHLAPLREERSMQRVGQAKENKKPKVESKWTASRKLWKSRVKQLCDELSDIEQDQRGGVDKSDRVRAVMRLLEELGSAEPTATDIIDKPIPCLDEQLRQFIDADSSTVTDNEVSDIEKCSSQSQGPLVQGKLVQEGQCDFDDDFDFDDDLEWPDKESHESSRSKLRALQCVLRTLIESPHINEQINANWVNKSSHYKSNFTDKECEVVAYLANALRPYVPRKRPCTNSPNLKSSIPYVTLRAPLVIIANAILRVTGYNKFTRRLVPQISPASLHSLALGPVGIYEVLCHKSENHFDVKACGTMVTDYRKITDNDQNKKAVLGSFFDVKKIEEICKAHGLAFRNRITFVDKHTIHLTGDVIPNRADRSGFPIRSELEHRKKQLKKGLPSNIWHDELLKSGMDKDTVLRETEAAVEAVKVAEEEIQALRKDLCEKEQAQALESIRVKNKEHNSYVNLQKAREIVRESRKVVLPLEAKLR
ncbi:hypothetical protein BGZ76_001818 [Entomortierella beljakovae]|nr:hypothetical protein BGZ76_001818 [Entomortierella beljakovae]